MTISQTPWEQITLPREDFNVRLVSGSSRIPLYWGRDTSGHFLFIIELEGDHTAVFRKDGTSVHGINVDLRQESSTIGQRLVLTLAEQQNGDLFLGLCETMISSLKHVSDSRTAINVSLAHLKRWKAFLAGRKSRLLSFEEIRGLFGELVFLRSLYKKTLNPVSAIEAWVGPDGGHQDFIFHDTAVEVKALSGKERNRLKISSEDQLESSSSELFVVVYRLVEMPESDHATSLNGLVRTIESELDDEKALDGFIRRLSSYGYVEMAEYEKPALVVKSFRPFRVDQDFPRLVRSEMPEGVVRVKYELELEKLKPFECEVFELGDR